jgi:hypothetical protein
VSGKGAMGAGGQPLQCQAGLEDGWATRAAAIQWYTALTPIHSRQLSQHSIMFWWWQPAVCRPC